MNKFIIIFLFFTPSLAWSQYNLTMYQLHETVPQANFMNPALLPNGKVNIGFPGVTGIGFGASNAFSVNDIFYREGAKLNLTLNNLPSQLKQQNYLDMNAGADPLYVGFWTKRNYFSLHAGIRHSSTFGYPGQLVNYIVEGNGGDNLGKAVPLDDFMMKNTGWMEISAGYGRAMLNDKVTWGVRAKYLLGGYHMATQKGGSGSIITDPDTYAINVTLNDLTINTAGFAAADFHLFGDSSGNNEYASMQDYILNSRNRGMAMDFGITAKVSEKIKIYASAVDIGSITWRSAVENYTFKNRSYTFEGMNLNDDAVEGDALLDSIRTAFEPVVSSFSYQEKLSSRFYAGGEYQLGENQSVGAMAYGRIIKGKFIPAFSMNYNLKLGRILNTAITYNVMNNSYMNIGAGLSLNLGFWQIYAATDNIGAFISPHKARNADFRFGMNMTFGRKKHEKFMSGETKR